MKNKDLYFANYGLVGINAILKSIDVYTTYKGMELDENFVEHNPFLRKIIKNKPLIYGLSVLYVGILSGANYLSKKAAKHFDRPALIKIATLGLGANILTNLYVVGNNITTLENIKKKNLLNMN